MDRESLSYFRRLEKDMLRAEKAYVHDLMETMELKGNPDVAAMEERQKGFEEAIQGFKAVLDGEENKQWKVLRDRPLDFFMS